jgi:hypothetical protein
MKWIKQVLAVCLLVMPVAVFASGTATGTITHLYISDTFGDIVYIELSGSKGGTPPACSTNTSFEFVMPRTSAFYSDLLTLLVAARQSGQSVTVTGTMSNNCGVASNTETIGQVNF